MGTGNRENKYNYPHVRNFIYCCSHLAAFESGMFVSDLCILFVSWHGSYIVVTCPVLCYVTLWLQINTNTIIRT